MSWLMKGIQSAVFHYASCAPCTGYMYRKQRRKQAKKDRKARQQLQLEQPDLYYHPEPSGTNPFWNEEIAMGPGPPPRRARKTNTCNTDSQRGITTAGTHSTIVSLGSSSTEVNRLDSSVRLSDDTSDDENWNRKRYQREDEDLWGFGELMDSVRPTMAGSSVGGAGGITRPGTSKSKSSADSYYAARVPPVNDLHPPVVSLPSPHPSDNRWMLQPPPKASVMSGKERATNRSRSGSGASSRVELSLQRRVSVRQLRHKIDSGETPEIPQIFRGASHSNLKNAPSGQRHDRLKTPQARPPSASNNRKKRRHNATPLMASDISRSSGGSSSEAPPRSVPNRTPSPPQIASVPNSKIVRVRSSRQQLSTVLSSGSGGAPSASDPTFTENSLPERLMPAKHRVAYSSTQSSESIPYPVKHRAPLLSSDISSLNVLQDRVSPRTLLGSRLVSAPLMASRIKLPPSNKEEEAFLAGKRQTLWTGSGFSIGRDLGTERLDGEARAPFDSPTGFERDPQMRWSVDF
ncbi:hypothetical protein CC78DRAFT_177507 [Lojkania enalia]|uniref:Signal peptide-containing protein n=1 Tax=Lojkania enalia TaxID=147567 RepID=A0A9P4KAS3_9PLEO|nr:hypothetical protein CC78DRAFT_177507 [Didymosphaeria enalia]